MSEQVVIFNLFHLLTKTLFCINACKTFETLSHTSGDTRSASASVLFKRLPADIVFDLLSHTAPASILSRCSLGGGNMLGFCTVLRALEFEISTLKA